MEGYWCKECDTWKKTEDLPEEICLDCLEEIENGNREPKGEKQNG